MIAMSLFSTGPAATSQLENGYQKVVGSEGVFATDSTNGAVLAIPNSGAHALSVGPYSISASEHNDRVRTYFVAAGIPADQIGSVSVHTMVERGGLVQDLIKPDAPQLKLVAYYSLLNRAVDGIPVADSVAWARFNAEDVVVSETVFWPEIPGQAVADAKKMALTLADPSARAAFRAKLPVTDESEGHVVIRHSTHTWRGGFVAVASYDVNYRYPEGGGSYTRHFGLDGVEFRLPEEMVGANIPSDPRP
ncbi:hypothetical protein [Polyangium mundeleinium]|uniref:Uncharacterized protein n=1 Tax=Polyangium mundeleinium TaxID=2995306 RepID=A0ABT5EW50_9BACT|nr:hypothetical protein [Polyangium mundeleinium]MDC0746044.1 hypothetical protein [Polyangium mundeleinium]